MATLNVFELTNAELNKCLTKESISKKGKRRTNESVRRRRTRKHNIPSGKIRVESKKRFFEDDEEVTNYTPEDDIVLVVDPDMEETPEDTESAEAAAEELVGSTVCKCAICGANYVCDHMAVDEDMESEESECPVCGETGEQIVVGEIVASDGVDETDDTDSEDVDDTDYEDIPDEEPVDDTDDSEYDESIRRAKRRTAMRREGVNRRTSMRKRPRHRSMPAMENRSRSVRRPATKRRTVEGKEYNFDEVTLNRMLTKFAKENYDNVRFVKITNAKCNRDRLTLEGTVVTKKGSKRTTKFVCENFKPTSRLSAKFVEIGAFTENATSHGPSFTIDFRTVRNTITPVSLKYNYNVRENRNTYKVSGSVLKG